MKDKIVDIEGKKFLMNFSDNSFLEIVDYNEPKINTLTPFSYIDTEETKSYFSDINYVKEKKKWGCINERNEVVIPCVYDNIDVCNNTFTGIKGLKRFDFDAEGVPIYKYRINGIEKTTRFTGWQYVERFDDKPISIGAKDGKIGILKIDGSLFLSPEYDFICIDWFKKCITTKKDNVTTQILYFEQKKSWSPIPSGFSFYKEQLDLYVLKKNDLFAGMDKNRNFVIAPLFNSLEIFRNVIIGTYNGKKGVLSRTETVNKSFYAPILQFVYDDIKKGLGWSCGTLSHLVIVKDGLQGVFCIKDKKILFEPKINEEYNLYTDTIGENSIGFRSKQGEYGFMDFNGNILFTINRFRVVNGKKISTSMIPVYFHRGFKNGFVYVGRGNYTEKYDKSGHLLETKWTRCSYGDNDIDYAAETWDAMTDGMYGDMPDGFDDDYSFLGH